MFEFSFPISCTSPTFYHFDWMYSQNYLALHQGVLHEMDWWLTTCCMQLGPTITVADPVRKTRNNVFRTIVHRILQRGDADRGLTQYPHCSGVYHCVMGEC